MATHGHKSLAEYIHQGDLIVKKESGSFTIKEFSRVGLEAMGDSEEKLELKL